jgi:hypothetical protein
MRSICVWPGDILRNHTLAVTLHSRFNFVLVTAAHFAAVFSLSFLIYLTICFLRVFLILVASGEL